MEEKDKLKNQFEVRFPYLDNADITMIFDFFYLEILARENANTILEGALKFQREENEKLLAKLSHQEEIIVAADEVITLNEMLWESLCGYDYTTDDKIANELDDKIEKYQTLKNLK